MPRPRLTPEERQARDTERRMQLEQTLLAGVQAIIDSDSFKAVLAANAKFHTYSANNAMLILAQCPTAERVAGFHTWKQLGRSVKKFERGLMIYAPRVVTEEDPATGEETRRVFFGIEHVFDISQTEGQDLPEVDCPVLTEERGHAIYAQLVAYAEQRGLTVTTEPDSPAPAGMMGYYSPATRCIWVRPSAMAQMLKTLVHELAHHHDEEPNNREARETIAEGVAFQVCGMLGIDTAERSFPYIAHWSATEGGTVLIKRVLGHIQRLTQHLLSAIESPTETAVPPVDTTAAAMPEPTDAAAHAA